MARINKYNQNAEENIKYLLQQVGMPYVWGGQHTMLTPDNYVSVIDKMESQANNRKAAKEFCEKKFKEGFSVLYGYDCSGLETYYLYNMHHIISADTTADGLMRMCDIADKPKKGYWVFRLNDEKTKATHIGMMVSDEDVVHAKGRAYGVVKERFKASYWHRIGKPLMFDFEALNIPEEPTEDDLPFDPNPPVPVTTMIKVKGSVHVRKENSASSEKIPPTPKNCLLPYCGQANKSPYWYETIWQGQSGFISSNKKFTELVELEG